MPRVPKTPAAIEKLARELHKKNQFINKVKTRRSKLKRTVDAKVAALNITVPYEMLEGLRELRQRRGIRYSTYLRNCIRLLLRRESTVTALEALKHDLKKEEPDILAEDSRHNL